MRRTLKPNVRKVIRNGRAYYYYRTTQMVEGRQKGSCNE